MSVETVSRTDERDPDHDSGDATVEPDLPRGADAVAPEAAYPELVQANDRICPRCLGWRVPPRQAAIGVVAVGGVKAKLVSTDVVDEEYCHPPRVPPPAARRADRHVPLDAQRACPPAMAACECGDIAGEPYEQPQSVDRLVARLPALYRRLVNYGYLLDASLLRAMVEKLKRNDR
jgi:hypothetical protein